MWKTGKMVQRRRPMLASSSRKSQENKQLHFKVSGTGSQQGRGRNPVRQITMTCVSWPGTVTITRARVNTISAKPISTEAGNTGDRSVPQTSQAWSHQRSYLESAPYFCLRKYMGQLFITVTKLPERSSLGR